MRFYDRVTDNDDFDIIVDNNTRWLYSDDVRIDIQPSTSDSLSLTVQKKLTEKAIVPHDCLPKHQVQVQVQLQLQLQHKDNQLAINNI